MSKKDETPRTGFPLERGVPVVGLRKWTPPAETLAAARALMGTGEKYTPVKDDPDAPADRKRTGK